MLVTFRTNRLERCSEDPESALRTWPIGVATNYINAILAIRAARNIHDLYQIRSLQLSRKRGTRKGQFTIRLSNRWRLVLKFNDAGDHATVWEVTNHYGD